MGRVVHFEISAKDPEKNAEFYKSVFGWHVEKWEGPMEYWLIYTGEEGEPGIDGGLGRREGDQPETINTIDVADVHEAVKMVEDHGGKVLNPIHAVPGVGWMAYIEDPEGNQWGLMQEDSEAKQWNHRLVNEGSRRLFLYPVIQVNLYGSLCEFSAPSSNLLKC